MIKSIQEQLVSAGLIDKKKAKKLKTEQHKLSRKNRGSAVPQNTREDFREASRKGAERDRELNRQRQAKNEQKAVAAQIRQIVHANRLPREEGDDTLFNFVVQGKVRKIYVNQETRERISTGKLAIVELDGQYDLIPSNLVEKLRKRSETCIVFYNDPQTQDKPAEDDYSDYKVPDDLIW